MVQTMLICGSIQISNVGGQRVGPVQTSPAQLDPNKSCYTKTSTSPINSVMILDHGPTLMYASSVEYPARLRHGRRRQTHVAHVTPSNYKTNGADWSQWPPTVTLTCSTFNSILFSQLVTWLKFSYLTTTSKKKSDSW